MGRFIALRELTASGGRRLQPGDDVPDAEKWPYHIQISEVHAGHVYDLHREIKVSERSHVQREAGLLARLEMFDKRIVESETHPGRHEVQDVHHEAEALVLEPQSEPLTAYDAPLMESTETTGAVVEAVKVKKGRRRG